MKRLQSVGTILGLMTVLSALAPMPDDPAKGVERAKVKAAAARAAFKEATTFFKENRIPVDTAYLWSIRALDASLATCENKDERKALLEEHLENLKAIDKIIKGSNRFGFAQKLEIASMVYYRIEAEDWIANGRGK